MWREELLDGVVEIDSSLKVRLGLTAWHATAVAGHSAVLHLRLCHPCCRDQAPSIFLCPPPLPLPPAPPLHRCVAWTRRRACCLG